MEIGEASSEIVSLHNGTNVTIRAIRPDDASGLQALHGRLSPDSVYLRFLDYRKLLTDTDARRLAQVNYHTSMAFVATIKGDEQDDLIGVARYALSGSEKDGLAEAAVVVEDAYQGRGLGSLLLDRLVEHARSHGMRAFVMSVHHSNARIMHFIERSRLPLRRKVLVEGIWEIQVDLVA